MSEKDQALLDHLRPFGQLMVAFSGGADSAYVLAVAVEALGAANVIAATAVSPSLPAAELEAARDFVRSLGARHLTPRTDELANPGYVANAGDRCYFCKATLLDTLAPIAGSMRIATGTNADDAVAGFRPGIKAADERGVIAPLRDLGFTKAEVRRASKLRGLSTWDKPAAACLSSRIAYGIQITPQRLARVEQAETLLKSHLPTSTNVRVRDLDDHASVEVDLEAIPLLTSEILSQLQGWSRVEVDPRGFRSGSMNELLV